MPESLARRAARLADLITRHRAQHPQHPDHAEQRLRARLRLAALLDLPLHAVTTRTAAPTLATGQQPLTLNATDPADPGLCLRFYLPDTSDPDAAFYVLGPCPGCTKDVPLLPVTVLADLAPLLADTLPSAPPAPRDPVFLTHPAHPATCPHRARATVPHPRYRAS